MRLIVVLFLSICFVSCKTEVKIDSQSQDITNETITKNINNTLDS